MEMRCEEMRRKRKEKKRMPVYIRAAIIFLVVVVAGIGICMFFTPVFHVAEVTCEGTQRIPREEIIAMAEVPLGQSIFLQRLSGIQKRVEEIPMVEEVKVQRVFPNKINIQIRERVPAAYLYDGDGSCTVVDIEGKVLEIVEGESVAKMKEFYTPTPVEVPKEEDVEESTEETEEESGETGEEETPAPTEAPAPKELKEPKRAYTVPFVVGLKPHKPEVGKMLSSKEKEKLARVMETFQALEDAKLLVRTTYMDVTDLTDVVLVVENRLEIHMGEIRNIAYRCQFLATVIREKISSTEQVIMDYRGNDIYVRQPEDGKERMIPKPTEEPEYSEDSEVESGGDSEGSAEEE